MHLMTMQLVNLPQRLNQVVDPLVLTYSTPVHYQYITLLIVQFWFIKTDFKILKYNRNSN